MVSDLEHPNKKGRAGALEAGGYYILRHHKRYYLIVYRMHQLRRVLPIPRLVVLLRGKAICERASNYKQWRD